MSEKDEKRLIRLELCIEEATKLREEINKKFQEIDALVGAIIGSIALEYNMLSKELKGERKKMSKEIKDMMREDEIINEGLNYIKFDEWQMDEIEKAGLKIRFIQYGKFILEKGRRT